MMAEKRAPFRGLFVHEVAPSHAGSVCSSEWKHNGLDSIQFSLFGLAAQHKVRERMSLFFSPWLGQVVGVDPIVLSEFGVPLRPTTAIAIIPPNPAATAPARRTRAWAMGNPARPPYVQYAFVHTSRGLCCVHPRGRVFSLVPPHASPPGISFGCALLLAVA